MGVALPAPECQWHSFSSGRGLPGDPIPAAETAGHPLTERQHRQSNLWAGSWRGILSPPDGLIYDFWMSGMGRFWVSETGATAAFRPAIEASKILFDYVVITT